MSRLVLALALSSAMVSVASAKDLCIQINNGSLSGSELILKKAKVGPRSVAPVHGYVAIYVAVQGGFYAFSPIHGASIVNSQGNLALGIAFHDVSVLSGGVIGGGAGIRAIDMTCAPGSDGKIGVLDPCSIQVNGQAATGLVVDCSDLSDVTAIP